MKRAAAVRSRLGGCDSGREGWLGQMRQCRGRHGSPLRPAPSNGIDLHPQCTARPTINPKNCTATSMPGRPPFIRRGVRRRPDHAIPTRTTDLWGSDAARCLATRKTATRMRPPPMPGGRLAPTEAIPARFNGTGGAIRRTDAPPEPPAGPHGPARDPRPESLAGRAGKRVLGEADDGPAWGGRCLRVKAATETPRRHPASPAGRRAEEAVPRARSLHEAGRRTAPPGAGTAAGTAGTPGRRAPCVDKGPAASHRISNRQPIGQLTANRLSIG